MQRQPNTQFNLVKPNNPILNKVSSEIKPEDIHSKEICVVIEAMLNISAGKGHSKQDSRQMVGLAAPQLGVSQRIITIDMAADGSNKPQRLQVFINPRIITRSKETLPGREGCWSCGNVCGNVERSGRVTLEGLDGDGKPIKMELEGFVARIAQHEIDHLDGIRFPDRIPVDKPDKLHWVEPAQFEDYRKNWEHWPNICPRGLWEKTKTGL